MPHDESMCMMNVSAPASTRPQLPPLARHALLIIWDGVSWILALLAFLVVRYDFGLSPMQWNWVIAFTFIAVALQCAAGLVTQDMPWTPRPAETRSPRTPLPPRAPFST